MMELDLVSGDASFLKSGAAASYIVRNGGVYCINACSMPIGITKEATPEEMSFNLKEGDTVIMLSDGIASDISDGSWIASTVCGGFSSNEELAAKIMKKAKEINKQTDDMTVFVISINKREKTEEKKEA
jgi:stage II sporulation protein E